MTPVAPPQRGETGPADRDPESDPELARYLNRSYWEARQEEPTAPAPAPATSTAPVPAAESPRDDTRTETEVSRRPKTATEVSRPTTAEARFGGAYPGQTGYSANRKASQPLSLFHIGGQPRVWAKSLVPDPSASD